MGNQEYVEGKLKDFGIKRLTPEQKENLQKQREDFLRRQKEVIKERARIRELEKNLQNSRPVIQNAAYVHSGAQGCGLKSVYRLGTDTTEDYVYYCIFCDLDFQLDAPGHQHSISDGIHELSDLAP
jgi:hypothetical protein